MALRLASPGINVREVDLTRGGIQNTTSLAAGIAAPFAKGPVNQIVTIRNEDELKRTFGGPSANDYHYEYWYSASNFLSYGGSLKVVRCSGNNLTNANTGVGLGSTSVLIENYDDYQESHSNASTWYWAAKNPGYWAEDLKVCVIDHFADQTISGVTTTATSVISFSPVVSPSGTAGIATNTITGVTTTSIAVGQFVLPTAGIVGSGVTVLSVSSANGGSVVLSSSTLNAAQVTTTFSFGTYIISQTGPALQVGYAVTQSLPDIVPGVGSTSVPGGYLKGIITGIEDSKIQVKVVSKVISGSETDQEYTENGIYAFKTTLPIGISSATNTVGSALTSFSSFATQDWYNNQNILDTARGDSSTLSWRSVAPKPRSNAYVLERGGKNDAIHVVVVDSKKSNNVSGTPQTILEKFVNLSKATDATTSPSQKVYYKDYIALNSAYIYAGKSLGQTTDSYWGVSPSSTGFSSGFSALQANSGDWGVSAEDTIFNSVGNKSFTLLGGEDYNGGIGGFAAELSDLISAYDKFSNDAEVSLNYLLQGSASLSKESEQAKANKLISIAETRKDCLAFISPDRASVVNVTSSADQLANTLSFFGPLTSSSYAVFDSGYQYLYDRFNQQFVYVPCSSDVAGLCVRTDINQFPWYSPAGKSRGNLKFAIKLAYNPAQSDRDQLYSQRINPIISSPGSGIILFGDKTALSYQSAFDRINVRRLFITIEQAIKSAADAQLFEFNDAATRANFINIVEPYLRDVQVKRGITDFLLVCDESNNTPDVIDRNEFIADIFVKPARSINFIGLTFVATRTGVSFETVVGTV
jgi:hypothetical protein